MTINLLFMNLYFPGFKNMNSNFGVEKIDFCILSWLNH